LDPTHLVVLLQKGALLDLMHKPVRRHGLRACAADAGSGNAAAGAGRGARSARREEVRENAVTLAAAIDKKIGALRRRNPAVPKALRPLPRRILATARLCSGTDIHVVSLPEKLRVLRP